MGFVSIDKIKDEDIKKVEQLNNRPNLSGGYGQAKLSAEQLKKWFDSYPSVVREKVDDIIEALSNENLKGNYIAMGLPDEIGNCLADLVNAIFSGVLANHLRVILAENSDSQTLVEALNGIKSDLADTIGSDKIADGAVKTDYNEDGSVSNSKLAHDAVYTDAIKDGAITTAKIAEGAIVTTYKKSGSVISSPLAINSVYENSIRPDAVGFSRLAPNVRDTVLSAIATVTYDSSKDALIFKPGFNPNVNNTIEIKLGLKDFFSGVNYDKSSGILTFSDVKGKELAAVDLPLELIVTGGSYDAETKDITLILANGEPIIIPLDDIVDTLSGSIADVKNTKFDKFLNPETEEYESQIVTDQIKDGAVTTDKLNTAVQEKLRRVVKNMFVDENLWFDGSGNMELRTDLVIECDNYEMRVDTKDIIGSIETEQIQSKAITIDKMSDELKNDINNIKNLEKRIETLEGATLATVIDISEAYEKTVPADVGKYAIINMVGGKTTSIESRRRVNLFDESAITYTSKINGVIDSELGVVENGYLKAKYGKRSNTVLWAPFKMYLTAGTYTISADMYLGTLTAQRTMYLGLAKGDGSSPKSAATTLSSYSAWERRSVTVTLTEYGYYYLEAESGGTAGNYTNLDARFKNILVTRENITEEPIATFEIPKDIRNREGYGSDGSYIDFDRKVFVNADGEEEDIAAELTSYEDFLFIEVLPLGTLRFVNEDGTETPVPSTITYQKKL